MCRNTIYLIITVLILFIIGTFMLEGNSTINAVHNNIAHVLLEKVWFRKEMIPPKEPSYLRDNIPDKWIVSSWDDSTQEYSIDASAACEGAKSFQMHKTNPLGAASIYQIVTLDNNQNFNISLCSKGDGGQIILTPIESENELKGNETLRLTIPPSIKWETHEWDVKFTNPTQKAQIWIAAYQSGSITWLDQLSIQSNDQTNLFTNPGFELDGETNINLPPINHPLIQIYAKQLRQDNSNNPIWHRDKAILNYLEGNEDAFIKELNSVIISNSSEKQRYIGWVIGEINNLIATQNNGIAQNIIDNYLSIDPTNPQINELMGDAYSMNGSYELAIQAYDTADPDNNPRIAYKIGLLYLSKLGEYEKAYKYLVLAKQNAQIANDIENKMVAQLKVGITLIEHGYFKDAQRVLYLITSLTDPSSDLYKGASYYLSQIQ